MLPDPVRAKLVALGSEVLGSTAPADLPPALRPVARFAVTKRTRLAATAIASAIESDQAFRRRVFEVAAASYPGLIEALERGDLPAAADPVDVAVLAYLQRPDGWEKLVDAAVEAVEREQSKERQARDTEAATRVREQLDAVRANARETRERLKGDLARLKEENSSLRRRLQQARQQLAEVRQAEQEARTRAEDFMEQAQAAQRAAEAEARRLRARLAEAEEAATTARRAERGERDLSTARLALLLDTLADAASGLRRELALPAVSLRPADTVESAEASVRSSAGRGSGWRTDVPAVLAELLGLPQVHLVVDGYNVTKEAWPTTPLEAQRARLSQGLGALAARTGAEVTCVFDGADVSVPPAVGRAQGVRVRFSVPGQTADELIRDLVAAEPEGRAIVVVSTDREVAEGVRRPGVHSVDASALVGLLRT